MIEAGQRSRDDAGLIPTVGAPDRALVVVPVLAGPQTRATEDRVIEAVRLAESIDLEVVEQLDVSLQQLRPGTYFGTGKVDDLKSQVKARDIALAIVDADLSPVQQRNLEKAWHCKVLDRTGLILEIFGERAQTREGRLQVELAHLNYQKSRLVRSWTHLERQRGGFGFLGGPGETQIESDRRMIETRVGRIEAELKTVATRRRLQRRNRQQGNQITVALVGYTNAGKSTLFNRLTRSGVYADDKLFATLDPTLRKITLPGGMTAIMSDTVGFVADLPTTLVAAFRATLEEVAEADLILHVRDAANPDAVAQAADVTSVLAELDIDALDPERVIEVWNKTDLLPPDGQLPFHENGNGADGQRPEQVAISAATGEGIDALLDLIATRAAAGFTAFSVTLQGAALADLHRLYAFGEVLDRVDGEDGAVACAVRVSQAQTAAFRAAFPGAKLVLPAVAKP